MKKIIFIQDFGILLFISADKTKWMNIATKNIEKTCILTEFSSNIGSGLLRPARRQGVKVPHVSFGVKSLIFNGFQNVMYKNDQIHWRNEINSI